MPGPRRSPQPRADGWRIIGPGGGGSLYHPTISPHDSRTALVACDMTGAYLTHDGGATWRIVNLGDTVQFFVFDPLDANVIYAGADGVFRSVDGGATWKRFFPRDAQIGTGDDHASGGLRSGGASIEPATALAIDPADSRSLYLALGSALWTSPDAGATWQKSADLPGPARRIWIDRRSPPGDRTLYVAGRDALYIRRDGKWRTMPLPGTATEIAGAPPVFYATIAGKIYVSTDGGADLARLGPARLPGRGHRDRAPARTSPRSPTSLTADCARPSAPPGAWPKPPIPAGTGCPSTIA